MIAVHTLRALSLAVGVATLTVLWISAEGERADHRASGRSCAALAQALASRALDVLRRTFGPRALSLQFFSSSLMLALCTLSAVYLEMLVGVGAPIALYLKYGAVFIAGLAGLAVTFACGRWAGLCTFLPLLLSMSILERTRMSAYATLFALATPGIAANFVLLPATRWCLQKAQGSAHSVAWLAGLTAAPFALLAAYAGSLEVVQEAAPRLSGFFATLLVAAVISFNMLVSAGLLVGAARVLRRAGR